MNNKLAESKKDLTANFSKVVKWCPSELDRPKVDTKIQILPPIKRASESIKYNILCLEYFLSPQGGLRQCLKMSISFTLLFLLLGLPLTVLTGIILEIEVMVKSIAVIVLLSLFLTLLLYVLWHNRHKIFGALKPKKPEPKTD